MAVYDEENEEPSQDESMYLSGPASSVGGAKSGGQAAPSGGANNTPSRFVEFERYFNANAGGANAMADKALSGVTGQISAANSGLKSEQDAFNTAVRDGQGSPVVQAGAGTNYISTPGTYSGPKEFVPSQGVRDNVNNAYSALQNLRTPGGLQSTLPKAGTAGNDRFNAQLASQAGQSRFDNLWNQYNNMGTAVSDAMTQGQQTIDGAIDATRERNIKANDMANMYTNSAEQEMQDAERDNQEVDERIRRNNGPKNRRNILTD